MILIGVKTTYSATVYAPTWCTVLMSAINKASGSVGDDGLVESNWDQPVPVAAYLIALAAGDLSSKDISERVVSFNLVIENRSIKVFIFSLY